MDDAPQSDNTPSRPSLAANSTIKGLPADIQQAVSRCFGELDNVIWGQSQEQQQRFPVPRILYHYTDEQGLLGIVESGVIRLTDVFGLNDPSEIRHGAEHACRVLEQESKSGHPAAGVFARQFRQIMAEHIEQMAHLFVACFSRAGDDLGQWRAYAANGSGFALGFDGAILEEAFIAGDNNTTVNVYYDDEALSRAMERLVHSVIPVLALPAARNLDAPVIQQFVTSLGTGFSIAVLYVAMLFKHEAYTNEQEYRFLHVRQAGDPIDDLKQRARGTRIVRFAEFDWKKRSPHALREVVIGPAADEQVARTFIGECLKIGGLDGDKVKIATSRIPYRG